MKKSTNIVNFEWVKAGYCIQSERFTNVDGSMKRCKFYAGVGIIYHQTGIYLYDTGYSERFYSATSKFPYSIYAKLTPVFCKNEDTLIYQLYHRHINLNDIKGIIISHFHADHIAGLADFPNIPIYCLNSAYKDIKNRNGLRALYKGFIPSLLPKDIEKRLVLLDVKDKLEASMFPFQYGVDIFGDNSLIGIDLGGHAIGQMGLYINSKNPVFLVSDACWNSRAFEDNVAPPFYIRYLLGQNKLYMQTLKQLSIFHKLHPEVLILPSHCSRYWEQENV